MTVTNDDMENAIESIKWINKEFAMQIIADSLSDYMKSLIIIDEVCKTTNSVEAVALLSGIINWFSKKECHLLLATHYLELGYFENVLFYTMKGLKIDEIKSILNKNYIKENELENKIKIINQLTEYKAVLDKEKKVVLNAIQISEILGLEKDIIEYAKGLLGTCK